MDEKMEGDMSYNILLKDFPRWGGGHKVSTISYTNSPLPRPTACEARGHFGNDFPDFARELYAPRGILFYWISIEF